MKLGGKIALGAAAAALGATVVKAAMFTPENNEAKALPPERVDVERYKRNLSDAIKIPTISNRDDSLVDWSQFDAFHTFLKERYPLIHENLSLEIVGKASLMYFWQGTDASLDPIAMLAHQDVVPVSPGTEGDWKHDPFGGEEADGYIWGRGALDIKNHLIGVMDAVETLLEDGFVPKRSVYILFGHNEETMAGKDSGASLMCQVLKERGVHLEAIVDETGYAPNTNPTYEVETKNDTVLSYDFDEDAKTQDNSMNDYDLVSEGENVAYEEGHDGTALTLKGGSSYVETPLEDKGLNTTLDFWVKRDANSGDDEQILFESEIGQIKAVQKETGNLGFSREARDYSFNYALPKGEWVHITMVMEFTKTTLYVNGEKIQTLERTEEGGNKWASLVTPLMRIGSQTKAFQGQIDSLRLYDFAATADQVGNLSVDLYDEASGVRVHGDVGVLPSDTVIQVTDQSSNEKFLEMAESILKGSSINAQSIRLTSGEEAVTPNGEIMISMPVGEMDQDTLALYEFRQDGTYEEVTFTVNNGMACWTSNHANGDDTAFVLLSKTEDTKPANKTLLQKTYEYALTLSTEGVTDTAKAAFEKALAEAEAVMADANATQAEVNTAWNNLLEGIWGLGLTQGDKTMLEQLINKADGMIPDQDKYMPDHWQELVDALAAAKDVMADGDAMEEDIQPVAEALLNAILAQRFKADKSILDDLINKAEGMDLSGYTAASVATFRTALANA